MFPWQSSITGREQRNFIIYNLSFFSSLCCNDFSHSTSSTATEKSPGGPSIKGVGPRAQQQCNSRAKHWQKRKIRSGQHQLSVHFFCNCSPWRTTVNPPRLFPWGWGLILLPASTNAKWRSTHRFCRDSPYQLRNRYLRPSVGRAPELCLWWWLLSYSSKAYWKDLACSLHQHDLRHDIGTARFTPSRRSATRQPIRESQQK